MITISQHIKRFLMQTPLYSIEVDLEFCTRRNKQPKAPGMPQIELLRLQPTRTAGSLEM